MAVVAVVALAGRPHALAAQKSDTLQLNNGDRIIGEVTVLKNGLLEYETDNIGTINVKWDRVVRLLSLLYFEVETHAGQRYFGTFSHADSAGYLAVTDDSTRLLLPLTDVVRITRLKRSSFFDRIDGYLDLGFSYAKSNETLQLTSALEAAYLLEDWAVYLKQDLFVQRQEGADRTSRWSIEPSVQRHLPERWLLYAEMQLQQNQELDLDLRTLVSPGVGRDLFRTNSHQATAFAGIAGQREWYHDSTQASGQRVESSLEANLAGHYRAFRYDYPELDLSATAQVYPSLSDAGRVRTELDLRARYEMVKDFFLTFAFQASFDNRPPSSGSPSSDITTTLSVTWKF
jgi:Protein of unknown function, DUF481